MTRPVIFTGSPDNLVGLKRVSNPGVEYELARVTLTPPALN